MIFSPHPHADCVRRGREALPFQMRTAVPLAVTISIELLLPMVS